MDVQDLAPGEEWKRRLDGDRAGNPADRPALAQGGGCDGPAPRLSGKVPPAVRLRLVKAALVVVPLVAAGALALARLDVFGIDAQAAAFTMALGDAAFEDHINPDLLLIGVQPGEDEGARLRPARRAEFARLIDTLSAARAKTIVFDIYITEPSEFDAALGDSIRAARATGRNVVFGFADIAAEDGTPAAAPVLAQAGAALGVVCV